MHGGPGPLEPLINARRPVDLASQVVHGDLPGNVLFADGLPPAVIDWPAYWRPTSWASAVTVADALCWYGASPDLAARWSHLPEWGQMLIRALIYRITTHDAAFGPAGWVPETATARSTTGWGAPMFFSSHDVDANRRLLFEAGLDVLVDETVTMQEPEGPATFQWVIATKPDH